MKCCLFRYGLSGVLSVPDLRLHRACKLPESVQQFKEQTGIRQSGGRNLRPSAHRYMLFL